jgi:hypothetical protein
MFLIHKVLFAEIFLDRTNSIEVPNNLLECMTKNEELNLTHQGKHEIKLRNLIKGTAPFYAVQTLQIVHLAHHFFAAVSLRNTKTQSLSLIYTV